MTLSKVQFVPFRSIKYVIASNQYYMVSLRERQVFFRFSSISTQKGTPTKDAPILTNSSIFKITPPNNLPVSALLVMLFTKFYTKLSFLETAPESTFLSNNESQKILTAHTSPISWQSILLLHPALNYLPKYNLVQFVLPTWKSLIPQGRILHH